MTIEDTLGINCRLLRVLGDLGGDESYLVSRISLFVSRHLNLRSLRSSAVMNRISSLVSRISYVVCPIRQAQGRLNTSRRLKPCQKNSVDFWVPILYNT